MDNGLKYTRNVGILTNHYLTNYIAIYAEI